MTCSMQFQIGLFFVAVLVCVSWTRLLYYDGLSQQIGRLRRHCIMHAAMIVGVSTWAMSIGFYIHHASMETINQQAETIQHLATGINKTNGVSNNGTSYSMAFGDVSEGVVDESTTPQIEVTTPNGTSVSVSLNGGADWTQLRRPSAQRGGGSGGIRRSEERSGVCSDGTATLPNGRGLHGAIY